MAEEKDLKEEYREALKVTDDESLFVDSTYKFGKIATEIAYLSDLFLDGEFDAYQSLSRLSAILNVANELKAVIDKRL